MAVADTASAVIDAMSPVHTGNKALDTAATIADFFLPINATKKLLNGEKLNAWDYIDFATLPLTVMGAGGVVKGAAKLVGKGVKGAKAMSAASTAAKAAKAASKVAKGAGAAGDIAKAVGKIDDVADVFKIGDKLVDVSKLSGKEQKAAKALLGAEQKVTELAARQAKLEKMLSNMNRADDPVKYQKVMEALNSTDIALRDTNTISYNIRKQQGWGLSPLEMTKRNELIPANQTLSVRSPANPNPALNPTGGVAPVSPGRVPIGGAVAGGLTDAEKAILMGSRAGETAKAAKTAKKFGAPGMLSAGLLGAGVGHAAGTMPKVLGALGGIVADAAANALMYGRAVRGTSLDSSVGDNGIVWGVPNLAQAVAAPALGTASRMSYGFADKASIEDAYQRARELIETTPSGGSAIGNALNSEIRRITGNRMLQNGVNPGGMLRF